MAEEAGEKALGKEEEDGDADGEADVGLRDGVAEAGQHDDEETDDDAAAVERWEFEREDEGEEVDGQREHPEQRDGGDVDGEVAGDGAQLHGGGHGKQEPEPFRGGWCLRSDWFPCASIVGVRRAGLPGEDDAEDGVDEEAERPESSLKSKGEVRFDEEWVGDQCKERTCVGQGK